MFQQCEYFASSIMFAEYLENAIQLRRNSIVKEIQNS
jgi:hypothetical protein